MSKNTLKAPVSQAKELLDNTKRFISTPNGKITALIATALVAGGTIELANSMNVREDKASAEQAFFNKSNYFRYKMLEDVDSLKSHGACAPELSAESAYYTKASRIVGPNRGIYEANQPQNYKFLTDNAKIYKKSAKLAYDNDISCFRANSKMSSLTPHVDVQIMQLNRQCAENLKKTEIREVYSEPTQLGRDMALAKNAMREIAIDFADSQKIAC